MHVATTILGTSSLGTLLSLHSGFSDLASAHDFVGVIHCYGPTWYSRGMSLPIYTIDGQRCRCECKAFEANVADVRELQLITVYR